jgi:hypothetical protein
MLNSYWQLTFDHLEVKYLPPASAPIRRNARPNAGAQECLQLEHSGLVPSTRQSKAGGL